MRNLQVDPQDQDQQDAGDGEPEQGGPGPGLGQHEQGRQEKDHPERSCPSSVLRQIRIGERDDDRHQGETTDPVGPHVAQVEGEPVESV